MRTGRRVANAPLNARARQAKPLPRALLPLGAVTAGLEQSRKVEQELEVKRKQEQKAVAAASKKLGMWDEDVPETDSDDASDDGHAHAAAGSA